MKDDVERGWQEPIYDIYLSNVLGIIPTFHFLKYIYIRNIYIRKDIMYDALLIRYRKGVSTFQNNFKLNEGMSVSAQ